MEYKCLSKIKLLSLNNKKIQNKELLEPNFWISVLPNHPPFNNIKICKQRIFNRSMRTLINQSDSLKFKPKDLLLIKKKVWIK